MTASGEVGSEVAALGTPRPRPLVSWVRPTRGYLACAMTAAAIGLLAAAGGQLWLVARGEPVQWAWAITSIASALGAAVLIAELARRPMPQAYRPRVGHPELRVEAAGDRRLARRAVFSAVPPAQRRLALVAANRLTVLAGNWYLPALYLFAGAIFIGRSGVSGEPPPLLGAVWALGGVLYAGVTFWARRQLGRLERAWQDGRRLG